MSEATAIEEFQPFLQPAIFVDSDHPAVIEFAHRAGGKDGTDLEKAVRLYYAVRDEFRYDPYGVEMTEYGMKGSTVLERGNGFCITKGALLAAACRVLGIPTRLGFADVPVFLRPGTRAGRSQRLALSPSRVFRDGRRGAHHSRIDSGESGGAHFASGYGLVERRASSRLAADHALCARA